MDSPPKRLVLDNRSDLGETACSLITVLVIGRSLLWEVELHPTAADRAVGGFEPAQRAEPRRDAVG